MDYNESNAYLTRIVTVEEVNKSAFSIGSTGFPGPDGLTDSFYQTYWNVVGHAVVKF